MKHATRLPAVALGVWVSFGCSGVKPIDYPPARRGTTTETLHGTVVSDPYRWMEAMDAPEVVAWARAQDGLARSYASTATRSALRDRIARVARVERFTAPITAGHRHFHLRFPASGPGPGTSLLVREAAGGPVSEIVGPSELGDDEGLVRAVPDHEGRRVAYLTTRGGSAWGTIRIRDVETRRDLPDVLDAVHGGLTSLTWSPDGTGLFYERFDLPAAGAERMARIAGERILFHRVGTPQSADLVAFARPDLNGWSFSHTVTADGRHLIISATEGATSHTRIYWRRLAVGSELARSRRATPFLPGAKPVEILDTGDAGYWFVGSRCDTLWLRTDLHAPNGRLVAVDLGAPERANWRELVPEAGEAISSWIGAAAVGERILIGYLKDARTLVRVFDEDGRFLSEVRLPREGSIWSGFVGRQDQPAAFYNLSGLVDPGTVYQLDVATGESTLFQAPDVPYDLDEVLTRQVFFTSRDGTRVPMFLVHRRDLEPGTARRVWMYGYGFGAWTAAPWFQAHMAAWIEQGGVWALPNLRGGGEYGEAWHRAGSVLRKQTAIDDYLAAAEWLTANGWTSPELLVANASSAGGAVAGAAIVQRPDLFGAAILDYPVLDMLRYERFTGARQWISEYGSVERSAEFDALRAYSPAHNVQPGGCYPAMLVAPGERDETTPPLHAYKFVAAIQHAQSCPAPVLLRVAWGAGHTSGATLDDTIDAWADQLAFLDRVLEPR